MTGDMRFADVAEGVRAAIAGYTQALDDGRTEDIVATFAANGSIEIPGRGTHVGHAALRKALSSWAPRRPQRHLVLNTRVTNWTDRTATAVSDVVFLLLSEDHTSKGDPARDGWNVQLVGRYTDSLELTDGAWLFTSRRADFVQQGS